MAPRTKEHAIEYLRSVCVLANETIDALKKDNFGDAQEKFEYIQGDVEKLEACFGEGEIDG